MLSQRGRYALKAMLNLARAEQERRVKSVGAIAAEENIPSHFLGGIMLQLRHAALVRSVRGKDGGYALGRSARQISFGQIMRITEGELALLPCASIYDYRRCENCPDDVHCAVQHVIGDIRRQVAQILDGTNLANAAESHSHDGDIDAFDTESQVWR